ncbi:MAG: hypothetical protein ACK55I_24655, partial [bacterium]
PSTDGSSSGCTLLSEESNLIEQCDISPEFFSGETSFPPGHKAQFRPTSPVRPLHPPGPGLSPRPARPRSRLCGRVDSI